MLVILNKHTIQERVLVIRMHLVRSWRKVSWKHLPAASRHSARDRMGFLKI